MFSILMYGNVDFFTILIFWSKKTFQFDIVSRYPIGISIRFPFNRDLDTWLFHTILTA